MANLFGLNIAKIVNDSIAGAGGVLSATLTKTTPGTRTPGSLTGGTNPTTATYACKGFIELKEVRRPDQVGASVKPTITILGASVASSAVPEVNDSILIDGSTYQLIKLISRDPASAVYEFEAES